VFSLAKTFTAALVLREVERGRIALDAPVPRLRAVGSPPRGVVITPRQLLQHTSGLVEYTTANRYREDQLLTPQRAVADSLRTPLVAPPGSGVHYANTNYLYLGLLLEHVTRTPYPRLVEELAGSLGLPGTRVEYYPRPGWVGFSSSGVHSTVAELVRWGDALLTPGRVLQSPALVAELTTIGETNASLGLWPICPCWTDELGTKRYTAIGHTIGSGGMYHYPRQMMLAIRFEPGTEHANDLVAALGEEIAEVFRRQR
jgi:D-alanyl-D-alanine carboxypeptidase